MVVNVGVALIPMALGLVYYHPKVLGKQLMHINGQEEGMYTGRNKIVMILFFYLLSLFLSIVLVNITIHQTAFNSLLGPEEISVAGSSAQVEYQELMNQYGERYRTFGHGFAHGIFYSILLVLPILGFLTYTERKGWKYLLIHLGFWTLSLSLMAGALNHWLRPPFFL